MGRLLRYFVALLTITSLIAAVACGDDEDPTAPMTPTDDAGNETGSPVDGGGGGSDGNAPSSEDAGDPTNITWQRLPDLPIDGGMHVGSESNVVVDNEDRIIVSFGESSYGFVAPHFLSVYRFDGTAWSMLGGAPVAAPDNSFAFNPVLAVNRTTGAVFVAYGRNGGHVLRFENNTWTPLPDPPAVIGAMVLDKEGKPVAIAGAQLTRFDGAAWTPRIQPNVDTDVYDLVRRGEDDEFLVLGRDRLTAALRTFVYAAGAFTPSSPPFGINNPLFADLAINGGGFTVATWSAEAPDGGEGNVFAGVLGAAGAAPAITTPLGEVGARYGVVAIDPANRAYVAWREPLNGLSISVVSGATATVTPLPKPPAERGTLPSITLDKKNLPVLSWEAPMDPNTGSFIGIARAVPKN